MSYKFYEVPLTAQPQKFSVFLKGVVWNLVLRWNQSIDHWVLDFYDSAQKPKLLGVALVPGIDLLGQHQHLGFTGSLLVQSDKSPYATPTFEDLGTNTRIYFALEE